MAFFTPIRSGSPMTSRSAFPDTERAESQSKKMSQPMSAAAFLRRCDVANEPMVGFSPSLIEPPQKILLRTNHRLWIVAYFCGVLWMDVNVRPRFFAKNGRRNYMISCMNSSSGRWTSCGSPAMMKQETVICI